MTIKRLFACCVIAACLALTPFVLAGCGREVEDERAEVVFWHSYVESTWPALEELIQRFEAEHPDIKINAQRVPTGEQLLQKLTTAIMTETAPDICWIHSYWVPPLSHGDTIYALEELIDQYDGFTEEDKEDFFPSPLETSYYQGKLRMMPIEATNLALAYNRDLFRKAGLDPERTPENWDEFIEYGKKLTIRKGGRVEQYGCPLPVFVGALAGWTVWNWQTFLWGWGGSYADPSGERVSFNSEAGVKALQFWVDLQHKHKVGSMTAPDQGFESQKVAMALMGPWDLPHLSDMAFDWAMAPMPAGPARRVTPLGAEYLVIFRQTEHPEEAWKFITWLIKPEIQEWWSMESNYLPIRRSVLKSPTYQEFLAGHPAMKVFAEQMEYAYAEPVLLPQGTEVNLQLATGIEKAVRNVASPKQALDEAADKANRLLAEAREKKQ
ncbi:MAG: ABC transporter substrate-binding protein [Armatimonadota bacterium]|nr:MAG: ABC transporter substrate-binding protein [Armatimonadota bacterium]